MKTKLIKDLLLGELFKLKDSEKAPVWVRGEYIRKTKRYSCYKFSDIWNDKMFKGSKEVFVDFEF